MKLVVQRVKHASVTRISDNKVVGEIGKGLLVLVGFKKGDSNETVVYLAEKLIKLRIMGDKDHKMNLSVGDSDSGFLVVSQFTLYANTSDGNRPSFVDAEEPKKAKMLYDLFVGKVKLSGFKTQTGSFGDYMEIDTMLDGPVTIIYEL